MTFIIFGEDKDNKCKFIGIESGRRGIACNAGYL